MNGNNSIVIQPKTVEILPWDSNFFGKSIARVLTGRLEPDDLKAILDWAQEGSIDCLYYLADSTDPASIWLAQNSGFRMVDIRTTLSRTAEDTHLNLPVLNADSIRKAGITDLPYLERIARNSFMNTRFYVDEHFPRELCDSTLCYLDTSKPVGCSPDRFCRFTGWRDKRIYYLRKGRPSGKDRALGDRSQQPTQGIRLVSGKRSLALVRK